MPRSTRRANGRPGNALHGFASMLLRLWQAERPRAVVVGWDTIGASTYRNELLPAYQSGRDFDPELLEQLDLLPDLVAATGIVCAKQAGFEADDFLAAAVAHEEARGGRTVVATSDRDAFQLVSAATTIVQPQRGVSEMRRIGVSEVVERYGVEPWQVVDFIALRGDPSDRIPGARGIGEKTAAGLLREHRSLDALLSAGRFAAEAAALRAYASIAQMDANAPLPEIEDCAPDWAAGAAAAEELGLDRLARTMREAAA